MQKFIKNHVYALVVWIVLLLAAMVMLPNVSALTRAHSGVTLPRQVQSEVANQIEADWGRQKRHTYQVGLVFHGAHGKLTLADQTAIAATIAKLQASRAHYGIRNLLAPNDNTATRRTLKSKDGTTWLVQLNVAKSHGTIGQVTKQLTAATKTPGVKRYVTGAAVLQDDFSSSIQAGIKKTEVITVVFIFIVLVLVFRSPIVPLISLLTVGISFLTAFSIVTNLVVHANFPFSNFTQVFMVIVLFGIGTDYNILLYDKFKENLGNGMAKGEASRDAFKKAGKTILYSGSSLLIGFSALGLARFSIYQSAVGVAVGVAVLLLVLLTLNPFFMLTLGAKMFWPVKRFEGESESKLWHGIARSSIKQAILTLILVVVVTLPLALMYRGQLNYDDAAEISNQTPSKQGLLVVQKHFSKGMAEPTYLYIKSKHRLDSEQYLQLLDALTKKLQHNSDVSLVTSATQPYGQALSPLYVQQQLGKVNRGVGQVQVGLGKLQRGSRKLTKGAQKLGRGATALQSGSSQLVSGSARLQTGTERARSGSQALAAGTDRLQAGTSRLQSGSRRLVAGSSRLSAGGSRLQTGANSLATGTAQLATGLNRLSQTLAAELAAGQTKQAALKTGLTQLQAGINALNQQVNAANPAAAKQLTALTQGLTTVGSQAEAIKTHLTSAGQSLNALQTSSAAAGLSPAEQDTILQQYKAVEQQAGLNETQKAAMEKTLQTILSQIQTKASSAQSNLRTALGSVGQDLQAAGNADATIGNTLQSFQSASSLQTQIQQLQTAIQQLNQAANLVLPGAQTALSTLNAGLTQVQAAANNGVNGASRLNQGAGQLTTGLTSLNGGLTSLSAGANELDNGVGSLASGASSLNTGATSLTAGLGTLQTGMAALNAGASQLDSGTSRLGQGLDQLAGRVPAITTGLGQAQSGLHTGGSYLNGLAKSSAADTFYVPAAQLKQARFQQVLRSYLSPNRKIAQFMIIFKSDPAGNKATDGAQVLGQMAKKTLAGTALNQAQIAVGGESSHIKDTRTIASQDFIRTAIIMIIGIMLALMVVTRSLLQAVYIMGTLLIAYLASLTINQWLVKAFLGADKLAWNTPFFSFIMIIALGVDYSIFLMTRYRESAATMADASPSDRMVYASSVIGTVVISAAIILAGTFAALIPSGIPTLIEVATTVIVGLAILVIIMPMILPAAVKLTYEPSHVRAWWHRKQAPKAEQE
ncbi:MAG: MMPL family transporter [Lactobacillus sp.]